MTKTCAACGASDWGTRNRCNPCVARKARAKRAASPEIRANDRERLKRWRRANPDKTRAQKLRQQYDLDAETNAALLAAQQGLCAVCRVRKPTCVDHCHGTGRVRGLLCRPCNSGLGQFRDEPRLLLAAAKYVEEHAK